MYEFDPEKHSIFYPKSVNSNHINKMNHLLNKPMALLMETNPRKLIDKRHKGIELTDMEVKYLANCMLEDPDLIEEYEINRLLSIAHNTKIDENT